MLTPIPMTRENMEPFGTVLSSEGVDPTPRRAGQENPYGGTIDGYRGGTVTSKDPIELLMPRFRVREFKLLWLERHPEFTQVYVPVTGAPYVWILARPDAELVNGFPALHELKAFINPGDLAIRMHPGTWHEAPMPFRDGLRFIVLSQESLSDPVFDRRDETTGEIHGLPWIERVAIERLGGPSVRIALP
jgi:ureidoglycolate lyase